MEEKMTQNINKARVGDRSIYYAEVFLIKDRKLFTGACEAKTKREARKKLQKYIINNFGKAKYKVKQIFKLDPEFEIEEVE